VRLPGVAARPRVVLPEMREGQAVNGTVYQDAPGVWAESVERTVAWALTGVLLKLTKADPEQPHIDEWEQTLHDALYQPVHDFDWEAWYTKHVSVKHARYVTVDEARAAGREALAADPHFLRRRRFVRVVKDDRPNLPDDIAKAWEAIPKSIRDELWKQAGQVRMDEEGLPFNDDELQAGLDAAFKDVSGVTDTARDALRRMMKLAYDERDGHEEFARTIRREFGEWSTVKAKQVAVTEWARAAETATYQAYSKQGVKTKIWYTLGDARVCSRCEANAADGDIPLSSYFDSGDLYPPAHPSCRCSFAGGV
jgi:SPP1 gp7 family putative phage head morphogenesis protein